jgi:SNF2 family DNA or RNA helicase
MLDLVQTALRREGFDFVRIDGSKSETNRRSAIENFRSNKDCNILLASIGTAGVG